MTTVTPILTTATQSDVEMGLGRRFANKWGLLIKTESKRELAKGVKTSLLAAGVYKLKSVFLSAAPQMVEMVKAQMYNVVEAMVDASHAVPVATPALANSERLEALRSFVEALEPNAKLLSQIKWGGNAITGLLGLKALGHFHNAFVLKTGRSVLGFLKKNVSRLV